MSKHTPGPWEFIPHTRDAKRLTDCRYGEERKSIGIIYASNDEEDANLQLIAACPDLLAALEFIVSRESFAFAECSEAEEIWRRAKAAIAKARGES